MPGFPRRATLLLGLPCLLLAHELDLDTTVAASAVVVRATYAGSGPVPFAKVQVFSPAAPSEEFHAGRTDHRGFFSFVPEGGGTWRVVVDDEEGHRGDVKVSVPEDIESAAPTNAARASRFERALLGLGLIFGLTGFLYGFKARRRR